MIEGWVFSCSCKLINLVFSPAKAEHLAWANYVMSPSHGNALIEQSLGSILVLALKYVDIKLFREAQWHKAVRLAHDAPKTQP